LKGDTYGFMLSRGAQCMEIRKPNDAEYKKILSLSPQALFEGTVKADYFFPKIAGLKFPRRTFH